MNLINLINFINFINNIFKINLINLKYMSKILAFDVGIKNLAFCILEKINDKFFIPDHKINWNIINLTKNDNISCTYPDCKNNITNFIIVDNIKHYFCTKHRLYHKTVLANNAYIFNEIDTTEKCCFSESCKIKSKWKDSCNKLYCNRHKEMYEKNEQKNRKLQKYKTFVKDFTIHDLKLILLEKLDTFKNIFLKVNIVCIENQPAFKNPTMKAISDVLYTWFLIRGFIEKDLNHSSISTITFFSPSNKLKIIDKTEEIEDEINNAKNKYKKTKQLGIENCIELLKYEPIYIEYLNSFQKKDDLCDAFLHAVHYINSKLTKCTKKITKKTIKITNIINPDI